MQDFRLLIVELHYIQGTRPRALHSLGAEKIQNARLEERWHNLRAWAKVEC